MTNDHASTELQSAPNQSAAEADDRRQQASERHIEKITKTLLQGWRALAFLLIVLIVGYYAFHYKALSDPGSESKQLADQAPLELDFFVSNPNASIDVGVLVPPESYVSTLAPPPPQPINISATIYAPSNVKSVTILMLTNSVFPGPPGPSLSRLQTVPSIRVRSYSPAAEQQTIDGYYAITIYVKSPDLRGTPIQIGALFANPDLEQTNAYLYGHLPAIGTLDQWVDYSSFSQIVLAELYKNSSPHIRDMTLDPEFFGPETESAMSNPEFYRTPFGGPGEPFWAPAKLSITESQSNLAGMMANQQINYMTPGGKANGPNYTWRGFTYLEPVFQITNDDALQSESNYAFLSGILFGIAGAAAIAFVQEIPETFPQPVWWSRRKGKRKASSQKATDTGATEESRAPSG